MKQIIILLLILGGGYYFYIHGLQQAFSKVNFSSGATLGEKPKETNSQSPSMSKKGSLPEIAPERLYGLKVSNKTMGLVETTVFNTYDADVCYAFTEMIYASGSAATPRIVEKYLSTFTLPEDKNKLIALITRYKDKQSLRILEDLMNKGVFSRKMLLGKIADYHTEESNDLVKKTAESAKGNLAAEAKEVYSELVNWDKMKAGDKTPTARRMQELMNDPLKGDL